MRNFLLSVSLLCASMLASRVAAQTTFPMSNGDRIKYSAAIEMEKGYLSGVCMLLNTDGKIKGSFFNEFGVSAMDFTYDSRKQKTKLHNVISMLNKWYIRRVLKKDLSALMQCLRDGKTSYRDERYNINYNFIPLTDEADK